MQFKIARKNIYLLGVITLIFIAFKTGASNSQKAVSLSSNNPKSKVREIAVTAKQFEFTPNPIRVRLGETVRLKLTSVDVTHGFSLPEFGINEIINPGQTAIIEFQATKKGSFPFACSVACGSGHANMRGMIVVE